jgi:pyrimidine-nucleoside phosphorylase
VLVTPYEIIRKKRDGGELGRDEIEGFVQAYLSGDVGDEQMSALLMAVYFRGMTPDETVELTSVMLRSGTVLEWPSGGPLRIDKHSTGGVGDKLSLVVAPAAAAAGVSVPMISGRGLGHTGGTLDKLESIPGLRTDFDVATFQRLVDEVGFSIVGQSKDVAPADGRMYALRDVTATVECVPLIVASILSKKLAAGLDGLVLDVKVGRGAFMEDAGRGRELAMALIRTAGRMGLRAHAMLTDMSAPIGRAVGNALEVREAIDVLKGEGPEDVRAVSIGLAARMLELGGAGGSSDEAVRQVTRALDDGRALERFERFIEGQSGDPRVVADPSRLPQADVQKVVTASEGGYVRGIDALGVGRASVVLGAGRRTLGAPVDPSVGVVIEAVVGTEVAPGTALAVVHAGDDDAASEAEARVRASFDIGPEPAEPVKRIIDELTIESA